MDPEAAATGQRQLAVVLLAPAQLPRRGQQVPEPGKACRELPPAAGIEPRVVGAPVQVHEQVEPLRQRHLQGYRVPAPGHRRGIGLRRKRVEREHRAVAGRATRAEPQVAPARDRREAMAFAALERPHGHAPESRGDEPVMKLVVHAPPRPPWRHPDAVQPPPFADFRVREGEERVGGYLGRGTGNGQLDVLLPG